MSIAYRFDQQLLMSSGTVPVATVESVLLEYIPGAARVERAGIYDDRNGTDWWVYRQCGRQLSIDAKVRASDWRARHPSEDDLALETWSVIERQRVGWTRDCAKQTDYILWLWSDTKRFCLIPFPLLLGVFQDNWESWLKCYKHSQQFTPDGNYHSECVFVPRNIVWRAIYQRYA